MIQSTFLNDIGNYIKSQVSKVLVNNSITTSTFYLDHVVDNVFELKFEVFQADTTLVTNIKLQKADGTTISNNDVSIPINQFSVIIRQTITISEVV